TASNEGAYWHYEMWLRREESRAGLLAVTAAVALAFRTALYQPLPVDGDADNLVPLFGLAAGKKVAFEAAAVALDEAIETPQQQLRNRIRQVTRSQRDTFRAGRLLNPFRHPVLAWTLWSHKLLRWWTPIFALGAFVSNAFLLDRSPYRITFALQLTLLALAS